MNLTGKFDLDGLLRDWPAPDPDDGAAWEERAARITQAAIARSPASEASLSAALAAPSLDPEPGEPGEQSARSQVRHAGETKMSQSHDHDEGRPSGAEGRSSMPSGAPSKKRMSLKEMAERASQSGLAGPQSRNSATATPLPGRASSSSIAPSPPAIATPIPPRAGSMPPGKPAEASTEDSGLINLKAVTESAAPPAQKAAAASAGPGQTDLVFEEAGSREDDEARTQRRPAGVAALPKKKSGGGLIAGVGIAVVGLAASFAIMQMRKPAPEPVAATQAEQAKPEAQAEQAAPNLPMPPVKAEQPAGMDPSQLPEAKPAEGGAVAQAPGGGAGAAAPAAPAEPAATAGGAVAQAPAAGGAGKAPAAPAKPGDLNSAMQQAVGDQGAQGGATEAPEPAAGKPINQNVPEQPSQGAAQAAIRSALPAAKACVAGADDVSRAQVTFSSSGAVSGVSVSGWATSHGATGCIKSAFQGVNVGPFSKPSYTVGVPIRP